MQYDVHCTSVKYATGQWHYTKVNYIKVNYINVHCTSVRCTTLLLECSAGPEGAVPCVPWLQLLSPGYPQVAQLHASQGTFPPLQAQQLSARAGIVQAYLCKGSDSAMIFVPGQG